MERLASGVSAANITYFLICNNKDEKPGIAARGGVERLKREGERNESCKNYVDLKKRDPCAYPCLTYTHKVRGIYDVHRKRSIY